MAKKAATMMFRNMVSAEYCGASRYTGYVARSVRIKLECGHELIRRASEFGTQSKFHCRDCDRQELSALKKPA